MWPQLCVSPKLAFTRLFRASLHIVSYPRFRSLNDIVLLLLFIVPKCLIPNVTLAVCACYTFTGNSGERQWQTWIAEVTCRERERAMSVCFAWECRVPQITWNQCELNCQWLHLLSRRTLGVMKMTEEKKKHKKKHKPLASTHCSITLTYM